ncbi:hypothetical protein C8J57DRAFT_1519908 [Mycena rebaudengoi]|nr:hypothetical protein C8J57DRAFT_1519908 [Mycena rebaudengoi]
MAVSLDAGAYACPPAFLAPHPTLQPGPCVYAATPPHYPSASQDIAILRRRKHNTLQAFTRKMHSASILIRSPPRRSRTTRRLYSLFPPKHDRLCPRHLAVVPAIKGAATIKEGLLDLVLDAKKLRHFLACLQLTRKAQWPLDGLDILLWLNTILKEVLASSVGAFAAFASMDIVFVHHRGTLPVTFLHCTGTTSTSRLRPFAHCVTSGPILPSRPLASALQAARNGGVVQNSDARTNVSVRRRGTSARGQSSGRLRMRERDERRAGGGVPSNIQGARHPHLAASTGSSHSRPSMYYASSAPPKRH